MLNSVEINVKDKQDLFSLQKENSFQIFIQNLVIVRDCPLDFFALSWVFYSRFGFIISEMLKDKIEKEKLKGMLFLDFNNEWP